MDRHYPGNIRAIQPRCVITFRAGPPNTQPPTTASRVHASFKPGDAPRIKLSSSKQDDSARRSTPRLERERTTPRHDGTTPRHDVSLSIGGNSGHGGRVFWKQRTKMYTDTMFSEVKSSRGNTCAQMFVTAEGLPTGEPLKTKADAYLALEGFCRNVGVPKTLVSDMAKEEMHGLWEKVRRTNLIDQRYTEPYSGWQNRCEDEIREFKRHQQRIMSLHKCPEVFWDFAWEYTRDIRQFLVREASGGRSPTEVITGDTGDTSEYMDFDFCQWIMYRDVKSFPASPRKLGRWLGIAHKVGSPLTYWVLTDNMQIIARSTVQPLLDEDWKNEETTKERADFDERVSKRFGAYNPDDPLDIDYSANDQMEEPIFKDTLGPDDEGVQLDQVKGFDAADDAVHGPDPLTNAEIFMPHGEGTAIAKVLGRKRNADGNYVGRKHSNPILDSRVFTIRFEDGAEKDVTYNVLAEQLYSQVE